MKKILILLGNTDADTLSGRLSDAYEVAAKEAGHEVYTMKIGDMDFDPVLHKGYKEIQSLESDLILFQNKIKWANHLVVVYPNWWNTMPAKLKGLFDRAWLPGFAFNFDKETKKIVRYLDGKSARIIIVIGSHSPFVNWLEFGDFTNEISHGILGFAGIKSKVTAFGPSEGITEEQRQKWLDKAKKLAKTGN